MEIERKFTVKSLPADLDSYPFRIIEQAYLNTAPVIRIRREDDSFYLTYKGKGLMAREEYNLPLDKSSYEHLLPKADGACTVSYPVPALYDRAGHFLRTVCPAHHRRSGISFRGGSERLCPPGMVRPGCDARPGISKLQSQQKDRLIFSLSFSIQCFLNPASRYLCYTLRSFCRRRKILPLRYLPPSCVSTLRGLHNRQTSGP